MIKLLKLPAFTASGVATIFLSENPDELCEKVKLLVEEIQAGNNSDIINEDIIATVDKLLEYKCISN